MSSSSPKPKYTTLLETSSRLNTVPITETAFATSQLQEEKFKHARHLTLEYFDLRTTLESTHLELSLEADLNARIWFNKSKRIMNLEWKTHYEAATQELNKLENKTSACPREDEVKLREIIKKHQTAFEQAEKNLISLNRRAETQNLTETKSITSSMSGKDCFDNAVKLVLQFKQDKIASKKHQIKISYLSAAQKGYQEADALYQLACFLMEHAMNPSEKEEANSYYRLAAAHGSQSAILFIAHPHFNNMDFHLSDPWITLLAQQISNGEKITLTPEEALKAGKMLKTNYIFCAKVLWRYAAPILPEATYLLLASWRSSEEINENIKIARNFLMKHIGTKRAPLESKSTEVILPTSTLSTENSWDYWNNLLEEIEKKQFYHASDEQIKRDISLSETRDYLETNDAAAWEYLKAFEVRLESMISAFRATNSGFLVTKPIRPEEKMKEYSEKVAGIIPVVGDGLALAINLIGGWWTESENRRIWLAICEFFDELKKTHGTDSKIIQHITLEMTCSQVFGLRVAPNAIEKAESMYTGVRAISSYEVDALNDLTKILKGLCTFRSLPPSSSSSLSSVHNAPPKSIQEFLMYCGVLKEPKLSCIPPEAQSYIESRVNTRFIEEKNKRDLVRRVEKLEADIKASSTQLKELENQHTVTAQQTQREIALQTTRITELEKRTTAAEIRATDAEDRAKKAEDKLKELFNITATLIATNKSLMERMAPIENLLMPQSSSSLSSSSRTGDIQPLLRFFSMVQPDGNSVSSTPTLPTPKPSTHTK